MARKYLDINVLDAAIERIEWSFNEFESIYVSFSGGKDSSVLLQLTNMVAERLNKKYDVLFIDLEAQYKKTMDHVDELKGLSHIRDFYHIALPLSLRNAVSQLQPKWICWNESERNLWVREMPNNCISINNHEFDFFDHGMEFEDFISDFAKWYTEKNGYSGASIGIRTQESINRWRTIASKTKGTVEGKQWTTVVKINDKPINVVNFYPIYDWSTEDVWGAVSKLDLPYNEIYEMMYKNGLSIHEQRLCQPYGDDQRNGLDQFKSLEYDTWEKVLNRVNGVNFGNIYARTSALGNIKSMKPDHMNWEEYSVFLLESIGLYNEELMLHYIEKIEKFIDWHEKNEGVSLASIPQEADTRLESQKKAISWRRIARAIERNDFYMKRLSFSQNKRDEERLKDMINKWSNILDIKNTDDVHLKRFYKKEFCND